jgi:glycosyltransferase involved in cell wall biosynthesis
MDIIVTYCEHWDTGLRTSKHYFIERLAADGHRVLYVEMPVHPFSALKRLAEFKSRVLPRLRAGAQPVAKNIWVMTGVFPLPYHRAFWGFFDFTGINWINQRVFLPRLLRAQRYLEFKNPILLSYYPLVIPIIDKLNVSRTIFHIVDEWQGMAGIPRSMAKLTRLMLTHADVTVVTSARLYERYKLEAKCIELLRHGTNVAQFSEVALKKGRMDDRLSPSPSGKKVGYYGALHKLDPYLISCVAASRPNWTFFFVGPLTGEQGVGWKASFPSNVHFLGPMQHHMLPEFLVALDVVWMPFIINELTQSMSPIKIYEVLSAGLPLVVSDLMECRLVARDQAFFAGSKDEHISQLTLAMEAWSPEEVRRRVSSVSDCDWNERYNRFLSFLC